jgi:Amt family ammonium transporter
MIGAGLLWVGWFGFNVGSIVPTATQAPAGSKADFFTNMLNFSNNFVSETGRVWINTCVATCAAVLGWLLLEKLRDGKPTSIGAASGAVAGLVAITPSCGVLSPVGSILLGVVVGAACAWAVGLKYRFGFDDSLDVVGVHLVGGIVGTLAVGFLDTSTGLFYGGGIKQLIVQAMIAGFAIVWSGGWTAVIGLALKSIMGWRVSDEDEVEGIDFAEHAETAYELTNLGGGASHAIGSTPVLAGATVKEGADA